MRRALRRLIRFAQHEHFNPPHRFRLRLTPRADDRTHLPPCISPPPTQTTTKINPKPRSLPPFLLSPRCPHNLLTTNPKHIWLLSYTQPINQSHAHRVTTETRCPDPSGARPAFHRGRSGKGMSTEYRRRPGTQSARPPGFFLLLF